MFLEDLKELLENEDDIIIRIDTRNENRIFEREIHLFNGKISEQTRFIQTIGSFEMKSYANRSKV